jgi:hypothetical protein
MKVRLLLDAADRRRRDVRGGVGDHQRRGYFGQGAERESIT